MCVQHSTVKIGPDDVHISYLPLAHMMERLIQVWRSFIRFNNEIMACFATPPLVHSLRDHIAVVSVYGGSEDWVLQR